MTTDTQTVAEDKDTPTIVTSQSERLAELQAQLAEIQKGIAEAAEIDAKERQEQLDAQRDQILNSIEEFSALRNPEHEDWERILKADCVGISITYTPGAEGEPPLVSTKLIAKVAPAKKAGARKSGGKRRDLLGEFAAVATPEQQRLLNADKAKYDDGSMRGRQHSFMTKVVAGDTEFIPGWADEHTA